MVLLAGGDVQNLTAPETISAAAGGEQVIRGGLVASQEVIKELGTNGGGYFDANSAHPFENPNAFTNLFEIFLILLIPFALTRTYGIMVGDRRLRSSASPSNYLRVYASQLRHQLEPDPAHPRYAVTEPGQGYRLLSD